MSRRGHFEDRSSVLLHVDGGLIDRLLFSDGRIAADQESEAAPIFRVLLMIFHCQAGDSVDKLFSEFLRGPGISKADFGFDSHGSKLLSGLVGAGPEDRHITNGSRRGDTPDRRSPSRAEGVKETEGAPRSSWISNLKFKISKEIRTTV